MPELCCKCPNTVRAPGQRYCHGCHANAQKEYRERHPALTVDKAKKFHVEQGGQDRRKRGTSL